MRVLQVLSSTVLLVMLFPVFLVVSLCIVLESGLPVFFRQQRVGINGEKFYIFKFRTMTENRNSKNQFTPGNSSRVTKVGALLRKSKLDELPQLINVFLGTMNYVGPRPEVPVWVEKFPDDWREILVNKPGITDPASILFRNEEQILAQSQNPEITYETEIVPRKLTIYKDYVKGKSISRDLGIIFKTILVVLKG